MVNTLADLGGLAGVAALITAAAGVIVQLRSLRSLRDDTRELRPDHGSSLADRVTGIDEKIDLIAESQRQMSRSATETHSLIADRLHMHDIEIRDIKKTI